MALKVKVSNGFQIKEDIPAKIDEALQDGLQNFTILSDGSIVPVNKKLTFGPVIGEVTSTSACIVIEVKFYEHVEGILHCQLFAQDDMENGQLMEQTKEIRTGRPIAFVFEDLSPDTAYVAMFPAVGEDVMATFKTKKEEDLESFKLIALSCDKPSRLLLGQLNPWKNILRTVDTGRVNSIIHIGDQIYPVGDAMSHAEKIFAEKYDGMDEEKQEDMMNRGKELWRQIYRDGFSNKYKQEVLSKTSNLMIWSDNDVANDFTTMKRQDGSQAYHPNFLKCGMEMYRDYQRRLWDSECLPENSEVVEEWHSHIYGNKVGIFLFDLRGNRITPEGEQQSDNSLLSEAQWAAFEEFMANPDLRAVILCSETPFLGEEPSVCQAKVADNPKFDFLKDHWYYNEEELLKLMDICFAWKGDSSQRDLILVAGDIHCGVTSIITDEESGLQINHYTTSPITNHVCDFFPDLNGNLNERYRFSHLPLGNKFRNYLEVDVRLDEECTSIQAKLVPVSNDIFKNQEWEERH